MKRFILAALLIALTAATSEARCKRLGKHRARHAVATVASVPVKAVGVVCFGGQCKK